MLRMRNVLMILISICYGIRSYGNNNDINEGNISEEAFHSFIDKSYGIIRNMIQDAVDSITFYNSTCKDIIQNTYLNDKHSRYFIGKLISKSSRHINDLSSYNTCIRKRYIDDIFAQFNSSFTIIEWRQYSTDYIVESASSPKKQDSASDNNTSSIYYSYSVFGLCIVSGCNIKDVREIIHHINTQKGLIQYQMNKEDIKVSIITPDNETYTSFKSIWRLFPLVILLWHIIISSFPNVFCCFRKCFRSTSLYRKFVNCFQFGENADLLLNYKTMSSKLNNESGLNYVLGIRGLLLFFIVLGSFFQIVNISPCHLDEINAFEEMMKSFWFSLIFFGLRIAPRVLLSCSGYILVFKMMCFLDNKIEGNDYMKIEPIFPREPLPGDSPDDNMIENNDDYNEEEKEEQYSAESSSISNVTSGLGHFSNDESSNVHNINNQGNNADDKVKSKDTNHAKYNENNNPPSVILLLKFCMYQFHIYLIISIAFISIMYSIGSTQTFFTKINPSWIYFHNTIIKNSSFESFCKYMIFFQQFLIQFGYNASDIPDNFSGINNQELGNIFKYEWIIFNEIIFFLITSILIYICYCKRYSLMNLILCLIIILILAKYVIFYCYRIGKVLMYSTRFYQIHSYGLFFSNPLYNYPFYLIGVCFGLINYTIQKNMIYNAIGNKYQRSLRHLRWPIAIGRFLSEKSPLFIYLNSVIGLVLIILGSISQYLFISCLPNGHLSAFVKNPRINFFYMIDIEVIVFFCHWCTIAFAIKGDNMINKWLSQDIWNVSNKFYCSFIFLVNPIILILLYQSETRISLTIQDIIFYSIISMIITIFLACIFYCLFESPYKRLIHLIINSHKDTTPTPISQEKKDKAIEQSQEHQDPKNN